MSLYGDPDELDELAGCLREKAGEVRQRAADHVRRGESIRWTSAAGSAYRESVARDRVRCEAAAGEMERAAALLVAHAQEVRETIQMIARFEDEVSGWFSRQVSSFAGAVDAAGDAARNLLMEPPWKSWPVTPQQLPGPGDVKWLEVRKFMQGKGVL